MSKCSGEHQHGGPREGHAHGHGTMWYVGDPAKAHHHHDLTCLREKDVALSALREECDRLRKQFRLDSAALKDEEITSLPALRARCEAAEKELADGLTAAHMDGFASGKAEAKEMLRKRDGQLEELRAEVKAYREVEDSLQKEIKRLDAEAERLKAAERIRVAGLRETRDALVEKLRAEVERLKALENKMGSGWALVEYEKMQARAEQAEKELAAERGKSKCNHEWKEWTSTAGRTRQCIKCGQQYSWFG